MHIDSTLRVAIDAVAAAGRVARAVQQDSDRNHQLIKDDRSPVTVADFAVQAIVAMALKEAFGDVPIVGEERAGMLRLPEQAEVRRAVVEAVDRYRTGVRDDDVLGAIDGCDHDASAGAYWTLDPIDGTKGFLRGQQYAIALALIEAGRVVLGVLGCPNLPLQRDLPFDRPGPHGTIYAARIGCGTGQWPDHEPRGQEAPVQVRSHQPGALTVCESVEAAHSRHDHTRRVLQRVAQDLGLVIDYARLNSQCKYAVVARGQADAYLRMPAGKSYVEKIWDHAAGMMIAEEAGAVVSDIAGARLDFTHGRRLEANRGIVCASGSIHGAIIDVIRDLDLASAPR